MNYTTVEIESEWLGSEFKVDIQALYQRMEQVADKRKRRGVRYPLALLLTVMVLAKLAGYSQVAAVAEWAKLRQAGLSRLFGRVRRQMPHRTTWSRVLSHASDPQELEAVVNQEETILRATGRAGRRRLTGRKRIALDGKHLRGTIRCGASRGVQLLACYRLTEGSVAGQVVVEAAASELSSAPQLLAQLELQDALVSGDAAFAHRALSQQIVEAGGDYLWIVKRNQGQLYADIEDLFAPQFTMLEGGQVPPDFTTAQRLEKGHGRIEKRTITLSQMLNDFSDWPHLAQVFKLERLWQDSAGATHRCARYGITSLTPHQASPHQLLDFVRSHWGIENRLHYRRDRSLHEDRSLLRTGHAPHLAAALNNLVLALAASHHIANLPALQRTFAFFFDRLLFSLPA